MANNQTINHFHIDNSKEVFEFFTERKIWVEDIVRYVDVKKYIKEHAPQLTPSQIVGVFVPETKKPNYRPIEKISYSKDYIEGWRSMGQRIEEHPVGFCFIIVKNKRQQKPKKK